MTILYHLFDFRYIYLGKTTAGNHYKIGIARDVNQRWRDIDREITGSKERPIFRARCLFAGQIERALHRKYDRFKVREKGWGREWFRLSFRARCWVIITISAYSIATTAVFLFAIISISVFLGKMWK